MGEGEKEEGKRDEVLLHNFKHDIQQITNTKQP